MMRHRRGRRDWRPGWRPDPACGRTRTGWLTCGGRACWNRCWPAGRALAAAAGAGHGHLLDRALNAEVTALCLVAGALFPALGYDGLLALVFGLPGVPARPGVPVPSGPAYSKARARHGEDPARAMFEADAAGAGVPPAADGTAFGLQITQIDG